MALMLRFMGDKPTNLDGVLKNSTLRKFLCIHLQFDNEKIETEQIDFFWKDVLADVGIVVARNPYRRTRLTRA